MAVAVAVSVSPEVILDSRLALVHRGQGWLAVADVHYGFSGAMRARGGLFPLWGDTTIEERLAELCAEYAPETLLINGDLVHGRVKREEFGRFLGRLADLAPRLVLVGGNHDRSPTARAAAFVESFAVPGFFFHHGHLELPVPSGCVEVMGHYHPAVTLRDGAGLRLKLPAFVEVAGALRTQWVLPAFSPWAGGADWAECADSVTRRWVCGPGRILPPPNDRIGSSVPATCQTVSDPVTDR
jgi:putative SbcD/Mre11-related phosphoesterase